MAIKTLNIGLGLGGCKFAASLAKKTSKDGGSNSMYVNISVSELDVMSNLISKGERITVGNIDGGAGKDRNFSIEVFTSKFDYANFVNNVKKRVIKEEIDLITVCFSTGGGTGSGIGPILVNMLLQAIENKVTERSVRVVGIALMPAFNEGIAVFRNALLSINDMNKIIRQEGRFIIVENSNSSGGSYTERRDFVNENASTLISEYVNDSTNHSEMGVLDMNDRRSGLAYPGIHAFARLRDTGVVKSTFIEPGSSQCKSMLAIVPEDNADLYEAALAKGVNLDYKIGYSKDDTGIVAWHGFFNIEEITLRYRKRFDQLKDLDQSVGNVTEINSLQDLRSEVFDYNLRRNHSTLSVDTDFSAPAESAPDAKKKSGGIDVSSDDFSGIIGNFTDFKI